MGEVLFVYLVNRVCFQTIQNIDDVFTVVLNLTAGRSFRDVRKNWTRLHLEEPQDICPSKFWNAVWLCHYVYSWCLPNFIELIPTYISFI